jgi:hypothetical protein
MPSHIVGPFAAVLAFTPHPVCAELPFRRVYFATFATRSVGALGVTNPTATLRHLHRGIAFRAAYCHY